MKPTIATPPPPANIISAANYRAAREFRRLRLDVFGRGRLAEERACEYLGTSIATLQRWEAARTRVPHAAVLALRERLRGAVAA